MYVAIEV